MPNLAPLQKHTYTCATILPFQTTQQLTNHSWITQESNAIVYTKFLDLHTEVNTWLHITREKKKRCLTLLEQNFMKSESNVYWTVHHCNSWGIKNQLDVTCYLYFTYYLLNMCFNLQTGHHQTSPAANPNTQRKENMITDVVIHQHSRGLLKIDILMFETCWANNKWNKDNKWHQVGF